MRSVFAPAIALMNRLTYPRKFAVIERKRAEEASRALEEQLRQAQKLESIGQLAAGIAHEINTPVQYVGDNASFLVDAFHDLQNALNAYAALLDAAQGGRLAPELVAQTSSTIQKADLGYLTTEIPKALQQSLDGIGRVAKIVRAMKEFSHPGSEEKTSIDLNHAIETTITVARNEWKYVAEMVTDFDPTLPMVSCLPGEINQVILNMIVNAAHAIGDLAGPQNGKKGTITICTRRVGESAEIRIQDSGKGIPESIRSKIFDPFFTTKPVGKGTGQGLTIAHNVVVKKHGGTITLESEVGKGTTFFVRLPFAAVSPDQQRAA